jgi:hypothetical protein
VKAVIFAQFPDAIDQAQTPDGELTRRNLRLVVRTCEARIELEKGGSSVGHPPRQHARLLKCWASEKRITWASVCLAWSNSASFVTSFDYKSW